MNKVQFKAIPRITGERATVTLRLAALFVDEQDGDEYAQAVLEARQVRQFLEQYLSRARASEAHPVPVLATLEPYYRKATASQWRLLMLLIHRLADRQGVDYKQIYAGIRYQYFPKEFDDEGHGVPKSSDTLTTAELSRAVEGAVVECAENGVDIADIYVLWSNWRNSRKGGDPLKGSYKDEEDYLSRHPVCEACGKGLEVGGKREGQLAHIVGVDEGGSDADGNRLRLCTECHIFTQHANGWEALIGKYPHVAGKIKAAKEEKT